MRKPKKFKKKGTIEEFGSGDDQYFHMEMRGDYLYVLHSNFVFDVSDLKKPKAVYCDNFGQELDGFTCPTQNLINGDVFTLAPCPDCPFSAAISVNAITYILSCIMWLIFFS